MVYIKKLEVTNFKIFGETVKIDFEDSTVIIGPNNSGKTSLIQSLALWHQGIQTFRDSKIEISKSTGKPQYKSTVKDTTGIGINRLDISQVPLSDTRQLWQKGSIRKGPTNLRITINVILEHEGKDKDCKVEFKYFKSELIYVYLSKELCEDPLLLDFAANLKINLLYPMSGIGREETLLQEGAIRKNIGLGYTANVLRNICYSLSQFQKEDWAYLVDLIGKLFQIELNEPKLLTNSDIVLEYNYVDKSRKSDQDLNIIQAGRGQQQMILLFAYVLWKNSSILLIDEPDAHLEILRQSQVIDILKHLSVKKQNQIIIATHSEVIMNEVDRLIFLLDGKNIEFLSDTKSIKSALRDFGIEHYYKAQINKRILYLEGSTDKQILIALAKKLNHPIENILEDRIFTYYTQNQIAESNSLNLDTVAGAYQSHKKHFQALHSVISDLKAVALFDQDNGNKQNEITESLTTLYWKDYEIENYFLDPDSIESFMINFLLVKNEPLFSETRIQSFREIFANKFLITIFDNNEQDLNDYNSLTPGLKKSFYKTKASNKKVSDLLNSVMEAFASKENMNIPIRKGDYYQIIDFKVDFDAEVKDKLDKLMNCLQKSI